MTLRREQSHVRHDKAASNPSASSGQAMGHPLVASGEVGGDAHAEVDGGGGVGEGADGDEVDAGLGVVGDGLEVHVAGGLDGGPGQAFADEKHGFLHFLGGHVVEQDGVRAAGDRLLQFYRGACFDLYDLAGLASGEGARKYCGKAAAERDVIVLDEDSVLQIEAVVESAAAADGVFVERTKAGN